MIFAITHWNELILQLLYFILVVSDFTCLSCQLLFQRHWNAIINFSFNKLITVNERTMYVVKIESCWWIWSPPYLAASSGFVNPSSSCESIRSLVASLYLARSRLNLLFSPSTSLILSRNVRMSWPILWTAVLYFSSSLIWWSNRLIWLLSMSSGLENDRNNGQVLRYKLHLTRWHHNLKYYSCRMYKYA